MPPVVLQQGREPAPAIRWYIRWELAGLEAGLGHRLGGEPIIKILKL